MVKCTSVGALNEKKYGYIGLCDGTQARTRKEAISKPRCLIVVSRSYSTGITEFSCERLISE